MNLKPATLVINTWGGLCNQMMDFKTSVHFAIQHRYKFCFRNCSLRNKDLLSWYKATFGNLFDEKSFSLIDGMFLLILLTLKMDQSGMGCEKISHSIKLSEEIKSNKALISYTHIKIQFWCKIQLINLRIDAFIIMIKKKLSLAAIFIAVLFNSISLIHAEPYISGSLGWTSNQKLKNISGDENFSYGETFDPSLQIQNTHYSNIKLKDVLQGGLKAGYFLESLPNFGIEVEVNYSQPNMKGQNVTLSSEDPNFAGIIGSIADPLHPEVNAQNHATEKQLSAKVKLLQFNLNAMYRFEDFNDFTPYIGAGPSINIIKISGTGESGHFVDPVCDVSVPCVANPGNVHDTSVNIGLNFKVGAEYQLDEEWGLGAEYHYNWIPVDISHFRSANNLSADLNLQSFNLILTKHF